MGQLKNGDYTVSLLQRIFVYGDDLQEKRRVRDFIDWFEEQMDPATGKHYDPIGDRQFYRYIEGEQHLPAYLVNPIAQWSLDAKFISYFRVTLPPNREEAMRAKAEEKKALIKRLTEEVEALEATICGSLLAHNCGE